MTDLTIYFIILMGLIFIFSIAIMLNQKHIFERYENDYPTYLNYLRETQGWVFEHNAQSAENDGKIIDRLDYISYDLGKVLNNKKILLTAADRGKVDEIIMALTTLGEKEMINYDEEIDFLNKIRKW